MKIFFHNRHQVLLLILSVAVLACVTVFLCLKLSGGHGKPRYCQITGYAQGGTYSVKFASSESSVKPEKVKTAVDSILDHIDTTLSGYNKGSQLSRFNAGEPVVPDAMFKGIYTLSRKFYEETGGALDVAAAPLFDAWGFGFSTDSLPSAAKVDSLRAVCGMDKIDVNMSSLVPGVHPKLNFNAIAQGYTCDRIADYLHSAGVKDMLVDVGEIYCEGLNPDGKPWKIGIDRPVDGNMTPGADLDGKWQGNGSGCGVVTSGNYRKYYVKYGRKYSHTIDPRTGYPVSHSLLSATIVAPDAVSADAYATYCMVIGLDAARKFIESRPDLEGYLIYDEGGAMKEWASAGFNLMKDN